MRRLIKVFFLFIALVSSGTAFSQEEQRSFDAEQIQSFRSDSDYQYEVVKAEPEGAFQKFLNRVRDWFWGLFQSEVSRNLLDIVLKLLLFAAFIYFIIKIFGIEVNAVFKPSKARELDFFDVNEENLDSIDFEKDISTALSQREYRTAIRLMYLNALYKASNAGFIDLKQGKTNREYAYELNGNSAEAEFNELGYLFDYTWYGHFEANERLSDQAQKYLNNINEKWLSERK